MAAGEDGEQKEAQAGHDPEHYYGPLVAAVRLIFVDLSSWHCVPPVAAIYVPADDRALTGAPAVLELEVGTLGGVLVGVVRVNNVLSLDLLLLLLSIERWYLRLEVGGGDRVGSRSLV